MVQPVHGRLPLEADHAAHPGGDYDSFGKPHDGLGYAPHVTRHDHGSTGLCDLAWYDADHFPKEYVGCMFLGNVVTNKINLDPIEWHGCTPVAKELPDFLTSSDPCFRPTDIKLGPDGALYRIKLHAEGYHLPPN